MTGTAIATLEIPSRFNGPPDAGQGGYCCGAIAELLDGSAVVELRAPAPLETPMTVVGSDDGLEVHDGPTLVARALPSPPADLVPPTTVTADAAARAAEHYRGLVQHAFPTCFVCGPDRAEGDSLRVFAGPVEGSDMVAAPWMPPAWLAGDDDAVAPTFVWSVLDCPSAFGFAEWAEQTGRTPKVAVLARMRIRQDAPVPVDEPLVVLGWGQSVDGRKQHAGSAIQTADGEVLAVADTLWIELPDNAQRLCAG